MFKKLELKLDVLLLLREKMVFLSISSCSSIMMVGAWGIYTVYTPQTTLVHPYKGTTTGPAADAAQALSTGPGMPSGPAALRALVLLSAEHTSVEESVRGWWSVVSTALMAASWLSLSKQH